MSSCFVLYMMLGGRGERKLMQKASIKEKQNSEETENKQLKFSIVVCKKKKKKVNPECYENT